MNNSAVSSHNDVIVLGGGAPGEHCAAALAEGGLRVALVERDLVGGKCSCWACIPSKTLLRPGEAVHGAREAAGLAEVDVNASLAWRDFMVSDHSDAGQERWLAAKGIELLRGSGRLAGPDVVDVDDVRLRRTTSTAASTSSRKEEDMEFLVEFEIKIPEGTTESEIKDREDAEAEAAAMLVEEGHLVRVWKLPAESGETQILGLYRADSETELDGLLRALPLYEWMRVSVRPLAPHPNDPARSQVTNGNRA